MVMPGKNERSRQQCLEASQQDRQTPGTTRPGRWSAAYEVASPHHSFLQAGKSGIAYDDVVEQLDIE